MTRDEVLEEAAQALATEVAEDAMACLAEGPVLLRALKCKPPEKSPEVDWERWIGPCVHGRDPWTRCQTCEAAGELQALAWRVDQLANAEAERDALRRELSQFDCRRTGGPASDVDGIHCPPEAPCMRCRLRRAEEKLDAQEKRAEEALARVKHIEWEMKGSPNGR